VSVREGLAGRKRSTSVVEAYQPQRFFVVNLGIEHME